MKKRCVVFVLIDGLADVSLQELDQQSPVEAAHTPAMDAIARTMQPSRASHSSSKLNFLFVDSVDGGLTGLMDPVEPGYACGSDTAHMSILGYNPFVYDPSRSRTSLIRG
jgi:2,3-bisphosphoglycerate-independent phosphoglycerate mutase